MTSVLLRNAQGTEKRKRQSDHRGGDWSNAAIRQEMPGATRNLCGKEQTKPPREPQMVWPYHLDFGLLAPRTVREYTSIVLCHYVCDSLLLEP